MKEARLTSGGLAALAPSDRVRVRFHEAVHEAGHAFASIEGEVYRILHLVYVASRERLHPDGIGLPVMVELDPANIASIELLETAGEAAARRHAGARGDIVFPDPPETARDVEEQLTELAEMIAGLGRLGDRESVRRRDQLRLQFDDIADRVALAQAKREYLLARARIGEGDFNPATWPDDRVLRIATVRPLPVDFELNPRRRRAREERRRQAERIFGVGSVSCHGFHPSKPGAPGQSIPLKPSGPRVPLQSGADPGTDQAPQC